MFSAKIGQLGFQNTATQGGLRTTGLAQAAEQCAPEVVNMLGPAVGQRKLGGMPGGFNGVELGGVGGPILQVKSQIFAQQIAQGLAIVDQGVCLTRRSRDRADGGDGARGNRRPPPERYSWGACGSTGLGDGVFGLTDNPPITEIRS